MKKLICIIGPSGSGKTTLARYARAALSVPIILSATTRPPRSGEVDGVDYHFMSEDDFAYASKAESASYASHHYGLLVDDIDLALGNERGAMVIVSIEGYEALAKLFDGNPDVRVISLFIEAGLETMAQRMRERGDEESAIAGRIDNMRSHHELENAIRCDYRFDNGADDMFGSCRRFASFIDALLDGEECR